MTPPHRRRGRPRLPDDQRKKAIRIELLPAIHKAIHRLRHPNESRTAFITTAILAEITRRDGHPPPDQPPPDP
jgi:hypothetical protein